MITGLLLTAAFPGPGFSWLAWIALVPLLLFLNGLTAGWCFAAGFIAGWTHFLTLGYWLIPTLITLVHDF